MRILIVGAGVVGQALAEQLSVEGHQVSIIDRDRHAISELSDKLDVLVVHGSGSTPSVLERAGIQDAEMVIAVTDVDEVNLVVGMLADRYDVRHRIVRVRNEEYVGKATVLSPEELGIDKVINPEPSIVEAINWMVDIPGCNDVARLAGGEVIILGFDIDEDSPAAGRTPAQLREAGELDAFLILYITRGDEVLVPRGPDVLQPGDKIHVLVAADTVPFIVPMIHKHPRPTRRVVIAGASRIGLALARKLQNKLDRCVLIEPNAEAAEEAANELANTIVLKGEATDVAMLEEASIDRCDLFCAVGADDQANMLAALVAKRQGAYKAAVVVHQPQYVSVMVSLGMDIVISPRVATIGEILMHVRRGHVYSVTRMTETQAEILELEAVPGCPVVQKPISQLKFPKDALIGAVVRDGLMQIPSGTTRVQPGDRVVVFTLPDAIDRIERMFCA